MAKVIAAMNMSFDGYCDHTEMNADAEIHDHYTRLLENAEVLVYGRKTYQLMEDYWPQLVKNPGDDEFSNRFANAINKIQKIVFTHTLKNLNWHSARVADRSLEDEINSLRKITDGNILLGSPSMIRQGLNHKLIDEYQIAVHPAILGKGMQLFKDVDHRVNLKLLQTKVFSGGSVMFYYTPV